MKKVKVNYGNNFIHEMPIVGFGAMGISEFYGSTNNTEAINALKVALDNGINHFDTADVYAFGENERFLSKKLNLGDKLARAKLIIASKAGIIRDQNDPSIRGTSIEVEYLKGQLLKSLANLNTAYLDIFYIHRIPPTASEEELLALSEFLLEIKRQGLVKSIGVSEPTIEQLQKIHSKCQVSFVQSEYSLLERSVEQNGILEFCKKESINFVAYSPLCRGMLTDSFDPSKLENNDFRLTLPKFIGENYVFNLSIVNKLRELANNKHVTLSSLAIAWLIAQGVIVIPGMRKSSRIIDVVKALDIILTAEDLEYINEIADIGATKGTRYAESAMKIHQSQD